MGDVQETGKTHILRRIAHNWESLNQVRFYIQIHTYTN